jgi:hypothetical protein
MLHFALFRTPDILYGITTNTSSQVVRIHYPCLLYDETHIWNFILKRLIPLISGLVSTDHNLLLWFSGHRQYSHRCPESDYLIPFDLIPETASRNKSRQPCHDLIRQNPAHKCLTHKLPCHPRLNTNPLFKLPSQDIVIYTNILDYYDIPTLLRLEQPHLQDNFQHREPNNFHHREPTSLVDWRINYITPSVFPL